VVVVRVARQEALVVVVTHRDLLLGELLVFTLQMWHTPVPAAAELVVKATAVVLLL
jgi:hypothetical protein